jgi:excisionase family DNA binding protein
MLFISELDGLLRPQEVAELFRVDPKTVTRWANDGKLTAIRTLGGHRRFSQQEVMDLRISLTGMSETQAA